MTAAWELSQIPGGVQQEAGFPERMLHPGTAGLMDEHAFEQLGNSNPLEH